MIIDKLTLYNFGIYAHKNTYEFTNKNSIVLIGGLNGRGKTTFLEAVLLALYGPKSFAFEESRLSTYGKYLQSYVNLRDGSKKSYVELTFSLNDPKEKYTIKRSWDAKSARTKEKIEVYLNGIYDSFLTENWGMFIENELPSALSKFFFFDGEKISALIEENVSEEMKKSIMALLGILNIESLDKDLSSLIRQVSRKSENANVQEAEDLKRNIEEKKLILSDLENGIQEKKSNIESLEKILEEQDTLYKNAGGKIQQEREYLNEEKGRLLSQRDNIEESLHNLASSALPLLMVKDLLEKIQQQDKEEYREKERKTVASFIKNMKNNSQEEYQDALETVLRQVLSHHNDNHEFIYDLSEEARYRLKNLLNYQFKEKKEELTNLKKETQNLNHKLQEVEQYLSVEVNTEDISSYQEKSKMIALELGEQKKEYEHLIDKKNQLESEIAKEESQHAKMVESLLSTLEKSDDNARIIRYSYLAKNILQKFKTRLQKMKLEELSYTVTQCYKVLANKTNLIERIVVDAETLELSYYSSENEYISPLSLSAGEKQLMIISLLWALAICSKNKLPVIIDTPLSRLDSDHRIALIERYFPNASDQTIILSTDTEIDEYYFNRIKNNVGDMFTLLYEEDSKATHIVPGYFGWEKNDSKTD